VFKGSMDLVSASALGAWVIGLAPAVATVFTAVWTVLRTIEQLQKMGWLRSNTPPPPSPFEPLD